MARFNERYDDQRLKEGDVKEWVWGKRWGRRFLDILVDVEQAEEADRQVHELKYSRGYMSQSKSKEGIPTNHSLLRFFDFHGERLKDLVSATLTAAAKTLTETVDAMAVDAHAPRLSLEMSQLTTPRDK